MCILVAVVAPAAPGTDVDAWSTTAIPQATLKIPGIGFRVSALSADGRIAVVADAHRVYLFRTPSEGSWGSIPKPTARLRVPTARLGNLTAVALSQTGTTALVAVGAVGNRQAVVFVFHASSPGAWRSSVRPTALLTDAAEPAGFGSGVALSADGSTALVGDPGGADVFHAATANSWRNTSAPTATLVADPTDAEAGALSTAVALSADGTTALIGTTSDYTFAGAAYIFRAGAAGAWASSATPDAVLTDGFVGQPGDEFGAAVALSPDGLTALVGAPNLAFGPAGAAFLFQVRTLSAWTTTADPEAVLERAAGVVPGWSVALSGEGTALVGEPSVSGRRGAARVFHFVGRDVARNTLANAASPPRDLFGAAVSLSSDGTTALISSARASFVFTRAGSRGASYCYVPYVRGQVLRSARRAIESTRCRVGRVSRISASREGSDRVVSQSPKPGARLVKHRTVDLRISTGR